MVSCFSEVLVLGHCRPSCRTDLDAEMMASSSTIQKWKNSRARDSLRKSYRWVFRPHWLLRDSILS